MSPLVRAVPMPVASPVLPACCSALPDDEPGDLLEGTKIKAGSQYQMVIGIAGTSPAGTWTARYGTVSSTGMYTAPSFMPPYAEDMVMFESATGWISETRILVEANPAIPGTDGPRYVQVEFGVGQPGFSLMQQAVVVQGSSKSVIAGGTLESIVDDYPDLPLVTPGQDVQGMPELFDCVDAPVVNDNPLTDIVDTAEADLVVQESRDIYALVPANTPTASKPKICKIGVTTGPGKELQGKRCSGGQKIVEETTTYGPVAEGVETGQIQFTAAAQAALGAKGAAELGFGFEVGVSYPLTRKLYRYGQRHITEVFKCINGVWTYSHSRVCRRTGHGQVTSPKWAGFIDGYPINGDPAPDLWTTWICN